jgi:hypothetical protein
VGVSVAEAPAVAGDCRYCTARDGRAAASATLYANNPMVVFPDGALAHVACEIDARRRGVSF